MALQECGLNINSAGRELQPHGTVEFPCAGYASSHTESPDNIIPWHWHEELEVIFINSNIPHYSETVEYYELESMVFSPLLITGSSSSDFATKYVNPICECKEIPVIYYPSDSGKLSKEAKDFLSAYKPLKNDEFGYEFAVREHLSHLMLSIFKANEDKLKLQSKSASSDAKRLEQMLEFIHENFADEIGLPEIARAAFVGEREALRCFKRTINESPVQYLMRYRLMQSAALLSTQLSLTIADVAANCGFDSASYFTKQFKLYYKKSPKDYRKGVLI